MVISCEQPEASDSVFEVSVKKSTVDAAKGQQFVSVRCTGDWTLALLSDEGDVDWASLDVNAGSGNKTNVKLSYETNATAGSRELRIVLDNGKAWTECSMVQLAYGQEQNPTPEPEPMPDVDLAKMGWLELPAMNDPNLQYFSFSFQMGGQRYRNYSAGYSRKDYLALWVAYPLCSKYTNGSGGSTSWIENPLVDDNYDSTTDSDDIIGIKTWYNERYVKDGSKKVRNALKIMQEVLSHLCILFRIMSLISIRGLPVAPWLIAPTVWINR